MCVCVCVFKGIDAQCEIKGFPERYLKVFEGVMPNIGRERLKKSFYTLLMYLQ